jgi:hypothetical protein
MTESASPRPRSPLEKVKYFAINVFLIFHLIAIPCWCIPSSSPLIPKVKDLIRPYMVWIGLFQNWDMFAPSPKAANQYLEAIVLYKDKPAQLWSFPRMEFLSYTERYRKERYRKFEENLPKTEYSALWPDAARFIARLNSTPSSPAQSVVLVVRWSPIIPEEGTSAHGPWNVSAFYSYQVKPEDLQ